MSIQSTSPAASSRGRVGSGNTGSPVTLNGPSAIERGITWNTGSTVFDVAPSSAIARRNDAGEIGGERAGPARRRARVRIARSLIACAWRMHSSSSSVFVSFAGASAGVAVDDLAVARAPATAGTGRRRARAARRAARRRARPRRSAASTSIAGWRWSLGISGGDALGELGVEVRATGRRGRRPRRRATTTARMWSEAGTRAPVAYETFAWLHSTSVSMPGRVHRGPQLVDPVRAACARGRACTPGWSCGQRYSAATPAAVGWRSEVCR